jgi:hypothetical protein
MGVTDVPYGYIGSMRTTPGHREQVMALLLMLTGEFSSRELTVMGGLGVSDPTPG